jgi:hypothetical protein
MASFFPLPISPKSLVTSPESLIIYKVRRRTGTFRIISRPPVGQVPDLSALQKWNKAVNA